MRTIRISLATLLLGLAAAPAAAEEPLADAPFPNLATLDRTTDHSSFLASLGLSFFGEDGPDLGARFDLGGQYLSEQGFGGYAALPISYLTVDDDSETEIGNVELGGVYVFRAGAGTDVVMRGGLVLPTGPDDFSFLINAISLLPRLTDLPSAAPESTWLRLGASPLVRQGQFFLRADVGLDVPIDEADGFEIDPLVRLNLAGGLEIGVVTVAGELVTIATTGDVDEGEDRFSHTVALSVGASAGGVRPFGALVLPIDDLLLDVSFAIVAGVEVPIATR